MDPEEKEIRRILQAVVDEKAYSTGHIIWIQNIMNGKVQKLRNDLKTLLDVRDCTHED
jgi:hypothetical protein